MGCVDNGGANMSKIHAELGRYAVVSSAARMPRSCWGCYRHVAVVRRKFAPGKVTQIAERGNVEKVIVVWRNCNVGKGIRDAVTYAIAEGKIRMRQEWMKQG